MKTAKEFLEQTDSQYRKDQCRVLKDKYPNIYKSVLVWMNQYAELVKNCDLADVGGNEVALCRCGQPISVTECDDCLDNRIISDLES